MNFSVLYYRGKSFDISILSKKKSAIIVVKSKVLKEHYETFSKKNAVFNSHSAGFSLYLVLLEMCGESVPRVTRVVCVYESGVILTYFMSEDQQIVLILSLYGFIFFYYVLNAFTKLLNISSSVAKR